MKTRSDKEVELREEVDKWLEVVKSAAIKGLLTAKQKDLTNEIDPRFLGKCIVAAASDAKIKFLSKETRIEYSRVQDLLRLQL